MDYQVNTDGDLTRVVLSGRLDTAGVAHGEAAFSAAIAPRNSDALVDLRQVDFLASLGVRMLLSTARSLSGKGHRMVLFGATPAVMEIIELTSLHEIVPVADTEADAIALINA